MEVNARMHHECASFGRDAGRRVDKLMPTIKRYQVQTILDYGCGQGTLAKALSGYGITQYDPCVERFNQRPSGTYDMVACLDVLEHIEPDYLDNVLQDLWDYTGKVAFLLISCVPSRQTLPDGRNAHLIQEQPDWWIDRIMQKPWISVETNMKLDKQPGIINRLILVLEKP